MSGATRPPGITPITGIPPQTAPEEPSSQGIKPTHAKPQLPTKEQDIPSKPLAKRSVETSSPNPHVNAEARTEKLRQNYLQQQSVVDVLETEQYLLDHLSKLQYFLRNPDASSAEAPFTIVCVGAKGKMASVIPQDDSLKGKEEEINGLRSSLQTTVKAIDSFYNREQRELLQKKLDEARTLLLGYRQALSEAGQGIPTGTGHKAINIVPEGTAGIPTPPKPGTISVPTESVVAPYAKSLSDHLKTFQFTPKPKQAQPVSKGKTPEPAVTKHDETANPVPPAPVPPVQASPTQTATLSTQTVKPAPQPDQKAVEELISIEENPAPAPVPAPISSSTTGHKYDTGLGELEDPFATPLVEETTAEEPDIEEVPAEDSVLKEEKAVYRSPEIDRLFQVEAGPSPIRVEAKDVKWFTDEIDKHGFDEVERKFPYLAAFKKHGKEGMYGPDGKGSGTDLSLVSRLSPQIPLAAYSGDVSHDRQGRTHIIRKALLFQTMLNLHKKYNDQEALRVPHKALEAYQLGILSARPNTNRLLEQDGSALERDNCRELLIKTHNVQPVIADTIATAVTGNSREPDSLPCVLMRDVERLEAMRFKNEFKLKDLESFQRFGKLASGDSQKAKDDLKDLCLAYQELLARQGELNGDLSVKNPSDRMSTITSEDTEIARKEVTEPKSSETLRKNLEGGIDPYADQKKLFQNSSALREFYTYSPD